MEIKFYLRQENRVKYTKKLLDIASDKLEDDIEYQTGYSEIDNVLQIKNGFFAFENAFHFFSKQETGTLNKLIKNEFLYDKECFFFAEDIFGNLFCRKNSNYYLMDIESGELEYISNNHDKMFQVILQDYNYFTGYSVARRWQELNGFLGKNERLIPKIFFITGGQYEVDNLYAMDRIRALRLRGDLFEQLKDVSDGEKIIVTT